MFTTVLREMVPNNRDGLLALAEALWVCKSLVDEPGAVGCWSERFAPNMEDIPRMMVNNEGAVN